MKSRDIIVKLIDENKITGEEAFQLINDIVAAEIYESMKTLSEASRESLTHALKYDSNCWNVYTNNTTSTGTSV